MKIREALPGDSEKLIALFHTLDSETQFMMMEPGERKISIEKQTHTIKQFAATEMETMLIAESEETDTLAGFIVARGGQGKRNAHSAYIVMGVSKQHWGKGVGQGLLDSLIKWANSMLLVRLELTVMTHNERALKLYKHFGFEIEGTKRQSLKIDGQFVDEFYMSKLLESVAA